MFGDDQPDAELVALSTLDADAQHRLWQYLVHGGLENALDFLDYAAGLIGPRDRLAGAQAIGARRSSLAGRYRCGHGPGAINWIAGWPVVALVFYRALVQAGNLWAVDAVIEGLMGAENKSSADLCGQFERSGGSGNVRDHHGRGAASGNSECHRLCCFSPGPNRTAGPFDIDGAPPVLQVVFSGGNEKAWRESTRGLSARDIAMNVALPEVDGRVLTRAVSFKGSVRYDPLTETELVRYEPVADRVRYLSELTLAWTLLRETVPADRRIALVLANYPNRDGRLGNGVGLDTPAGAIELLGAMKKAGYGITDIPTDGDALIDLVMAGPTNAFEDLDNRNISETLTMAVYEDFFGGLSKVVQDAVRERWGAPEADPSFDRTRSVTGISLFPPSGWATSPSVCNRPEATTLIQRRPTTTRTWFRHTTTWPSTLGCATHFGPMPLFTLASTEIWNGCRERRWRYRKIVFQKRPSARCRIFIPLLSMIRARVRRQNAARVRS